MNDLILSLHAIGAIKFGTFEIKREFISPFRVDLSGVISHPKIAKKVCSCIWEKGQSFSFDLLCGVPLIGNCFANYLAWEHNLPLVVCRQDKAQAKMQTKIVGSYKTGQRALLIQDLHIFGTSTLDTIDHLESEGIEVRDILTFIDLGFGAKKKIKARGYIPHAVITISEIVQILFEANKIPGDTHKLTADFLETQKTNGNG